MRCAVSVHLPPRYTASRTMFAVPAFFNDLAGGTKPEKIVVSGKYHLNVGLVLVSDVFVNFNGRFWQTFF